MCPSLASAPVVDTAALLWSPKIAPAPIEASPFSALFDPSAVLSSMKALFPLRCNCAWRARLVISPALELDRAVAGQLNVAAQGPGGAESRGAGHVEERLIGAGAGQLDFAVLSSDAAVTSSDAER